MVREAARDETLFKQFAQHENEIRRVLEPVFCLVIQLKPLRRAAFQNSRNILEALEYKAQRPLKNKVLSMAVIEKLERKYSSTIGAQGHEIDVRAIRYIHTDLKRNCPDLDLLRSKFPHFVNGLLNYVHSVNGNQVINFELLLDELHSYLIDTLEIFLTHLDIQSKSRRLDEDEIMGTIFEDIKHNAQLSAGRITLYWLVYQLCGEIQKAEVFRRALVDYAAGNLFLGVSSGDEVVLLCA